MIKLERTCVMNFENAIRGARNPLNSWDKMDSMKILDKFDIGKNDYKMLKKLCNNSITF